MKFDLARINQERERRGLPLLPLRGKAGRPPGPRPSKAELIRLYVTQGLSIRATARSLGLSKDTLQRALVEYRVKRRPPSRTKPSRLAVYGLALLRRRVKADGLRATARALEIDPSTLREYLQRKMKVKG